MNEDKRVYLAAIRREMQRRFNFKNRNDAFITFWYGWVHQCMRRFKISHNTFANKWKRGYINKREAKDFWNYIIQ